MKGYTAGETLERITRQGAAIAGLVVCLYGLALFGAQVLSWLRTAEWRQIPLAAIFWVPADATFPLSLLPRWFFSERVSSYIMEAPAGSWLGLRALALFFLNELPLTLTAIALGAWLGLSQAAELVKLQERCEERMRKRTAATDSDRTTDAERASPN